MRSLGILLLVFCGSVAYADTEPAWITTGAADGPRHFFRSIEDLEVANTLFENVVGVNGIGQPLNAGGQVSTRWDQNSSGIPDMWEFKLIEAVILRPNDFDIVDSVFHDLIHEAWKTNVAQMFLDADAALIGLGAEAAERFEASLALYMTYGTLLSSGFVQVTSGSLSFSINVANYDTSPATLLDPNLDIDSDGTTNILEYFNVISRGASIEEFIRAILDDTCDGSVDCVPPPPPPPSVQVIRFEKPGPLQEGETAVFSATEIVGTFGSVVYQWLKDEFPVVEGGRISGVSTPTLTIQNVIISDSGVYKIRFFDQSKGGPFFGPDMVLGVFEVGALPAAGLLGLGILVGLFLVGGALHLQRKQ